MQVYNKFWQNLRSYEFVEYECWKRHKYKFNNKNKNNSSVHTNVRNDAIIRPKKAERFGRATPTPRKHYWNGKG